MKIQIDLCKEIRTPEQNAIVERCYQAVKVLRAAGFRAEVELYIVSSPKDCPAAIVLSE